MRPEQAQVELCKS